MIVVLDDNNVVINILNTDVPIEDNQRLYLPWSVLGEVYSDIAPLAYLKTQKLSEVEAYIQSLYVGGFQSSASGELMWYDSTRDDQSNMDTMWQATQSPNFVAKTGGTLPVRYCETKGGEKIEVSLNAAQIQTLCDDKAIHIMTVKQTGWALSAAVESATTVEELEAIKWEA